MFGRFRVRQRLKALRRLIDGRVEKIIPTTIRIKSETFSTTQDVRFLPHH